MHFWYFVNVKIPGLKKKEIVYNYMGKFILKSRFSVQVTTPNKHRIIIKLMKMLTTEVSAGTTVIITVICLLTAIINSSRQKLES